MHVLVAGAHRPPELLPVLEEPLPLLLEQGALLRGIGEVVHLRLRHPPAAKAGFVGVHVKPLAELLPRVAQGVDLLGLDVRGVHAVLAVEKLDHVTRAVPHGSVVFHDDVLHRLHQSPLDVTRLGRLHRGVDETLATAHGVEEELLRREAAQVGVLDKPASLGAEVVLRKVRQRPVGEPERDALTLDVLLAHARDHLRDVEERTLGTGRHRHLHVVGVVERRLSRVTRVVARLVENLVNLLLERLLRGHAGLHLQLAPLVDGDNLLHVGLGLGDRVVDRLHGPVVGDGVGDSNREAVVEEPVVEEPLHLRDKVARRGGAPLLPDGVDQTSAAAAHRFLAHDAGDELAAFHSHADVIHGKVHVVGVACPRGRSDDVDVGGEHGEHLLARPQGLGLDDGRFRHLAIPVGVPHEDVHEDVLRDERVALGDQAAREKRVLHDRHHRLVRLRGHDHLRHHHQLLHLRARLHALRQVHVHLVAVEIRVVRRRHRDVHPKSGVGHDPNPVTHDGHLVQRRLTVEEHAVAVDHVPLHLVPVLESLVALAFHEPKVQALAILADDVLGPSLARGRVRAVLDELTQALDVVRGHRLRVGHVESDRPRDAELVEHQVGVGRDHRARRKVNALTHQVTPNPASLTLETLGD